MTKKLKAGSLLDDSYSSYWLDDSTGVFKEKDPDAEVDDKDNGSLERLMKLAAIRRATSNFVRIITNDPKIEVRYSSGKDSYTDGKTVVISADADPKHFDSMVGLALHEGSHCLLSDFNFLKAILTEHVFYNALHPTLRKLFPMDFNRALTEANRNTVKTLLQNMMFLMNIIEDRRIDSFVYKAAPGYRPYYDALYTRYFLNKDVENNLRRNQEWRQPTVDNYINWLVLMFSPHFNPRALRGLTKMVRIIDLPNIRRFDNNAKIHNYGKWTMDSVTGIYDYEQFSPLWKAANELMIEILRQVKFQAKDFTKDNSPFGSLDINMDGLDGDMEEFDSDELENLDPVEAGKFNEVRGKKALDKIKQVLKGDIKRKRLKKNEREQIESMEDASAKITENGDPVFGKIPCLVTRELNKHILHSEWFPFVYGYASWDGNNNRELRKNQEAEAGVLDGVRMGAILAQRLAVRNDANMTHFTRQNQGKIDRRVLAQLGMEIESVFKRTTVDQYNPVLLYLSLDASGSMNGPKWRKAMSVATALTFASDKIRNLDVVVSLRGNSKSGSGIPCVSVVYDSRKDNFKKAREIFPFLAPTGSTPEGLCYTATLELIQECAVTHNTYFINFSDGEPGTNFRYNGQYFNYAGDMATKQTKNMVRQIREAGVKVMSYFIDDSRNGYYGNYSKTAFTTMYGADAEFVNVQNVTQVLKTLNKLLMVRG